MKIKYAIILVILFCFITACQSSFELSGNRIAHRDLVSTQTQPIQKINHYGINTSNGANTPEALADKPFNFSASSGSYYTLPYSPSKVLIPKTNNSQQIEVKNVSENTRTTASSSSQEPLYDSSATASAIAFGVALFFLALSPFIISLLVVALLAAFIGMLLGLEGIKHIKHSPSTKGKFLAYLGFIGCGLILLSFVIFLGVVVSTAK